MNTPEEHAADPPESWTVVGSGRNWALKSSRGHTIDSFPTRKAALAAKVDGHAVRMYRAEAEWMAGGQGLPGWKPYAVVVAERAASDAWCAARAAAKAAS